MKLKQYLNMYRVSSWADQIPGGSDINFNDLDKAMDWVHTYTRCLGCEQGGGPPDCVIRICAKEKGFDLCTECSELEDCDKFDWLGGSIKENLKKSIGMSKQDLIEQAISKIKQ